VTKLKKKLFAILRDYLLITVSCLLYAATFNCFYATNNLAMGGFTGISQVINRLVPVLPVGTTVFLMNVPLMIIGVKKQGWGILLASAYAIFVSSVMIDTLDILVEFPPMEPLLASLYGGVLTGVSLGLMLLKNATTGGTELAARLLKYVLRSISVGKLCLIIDVSVICIYALTFKSLDNALYGIISMYVCSLAMDMVVYGSINAKLAIIVSDRVEAITARLMDMGLGATILHGRGAYTGKDKRILMCAVRPGKIGQIKTAVAAEDPEKAFIIVCDAREVFGEGFGEYGADSL
jgi:uncharacterized membrane-anchored protein YitT (DUF2179 family)